MAGLLKKLSAIFASNPVTELGDDDLILLTVDSETSPLSGAMRKDALFAQIEAEIVPVSDGWNPYTAVTPTRASADDPTYVLTFAGVDLTGLISAGMKWKLTQNGTTRYGFVTAISFSTNTTMTVYGGTDYDVDDTATYAISNFAYSSHKAPFGFPLSPAKWTVTTTNTTDYTKTSPTVNTWYGGTNAMDSSATLPTIVLPIGIWNVAFKGVVRSALTVASYARIDITLSNTQTTESTSEFTCSYSVNAGLDAGGSLVNKPTAVSPVVLVDVAAKTTYRLLVQTVNASTATLILQGTGGTTLIKAVCAYL